MINKIKSNVKCLNRLERYIKIKILQNLIKNNILVSQNMREQYR